MDISRILPRIPITASQFMAMVATNQAGGFLRTISLIGAIGRPPIGQQIPITINPFGIPLTTTRGINPIRRITGMPGFTHLAPATGPDTAITAHTMVGLTATIITMAATMVAHTVTGHPASR
jgi:hypothetical protein